LNEITVYSINSNIYDVRTEHLVTVGANMSACWMWHHAAQ